LALETIVRYITSIAEFNGSSPIEFNPMNARKGDVGLDAGTEIPPRTGSPKAETVVYR
jgi:hypothetical protein